MPTEQPPANHEQLPAERAGGVDPAREVGRVVDVCLKFHPAQGAGAELDFARVRLEPGTAGLETAHRAAAVAAVAAFVQPYGDAASDAAGADPHSLIGRRVGLADFHRDFAQALLDPPHGIHPGRSGYADETTLLAAVVRDVLESPTEDAVICEWDGNWCSYFDAGREWWGASAWTVQAEDDVIIVVGASATD